jgi:hypothetical protein
MVCFHYKSLQQLRYRSVCCRRWRCELYATWHSPVSELSVPVSDSGTINACSLASFVTTALILTQLIALIMFHFVIVAYISGFICCLMHWI